MIDLANKTAPPWRARRNAHSEPVQALARHPLNGDYRYWRGLSGKRYLHKVYSLSDWPCYENANVMLVRRMEGGTHKILWVGQTASIGGLPRERGVLARAAMCGANEVHVHLLGTSSQDRTLIEQDLSMAQHDTPAHDSCTATCQDRDTMAGIAGAHTNVILAIGPS